MLMAQEDIFKRQILVQTKASRQGKVGSYIIRDPKKAILGIAAVFRS